MSRFLVTHAARNDLIGIARHTRKHWGIEKRKQYLTQLDAAFHLLADNPTLGKSCDYIKSGYRKFPVAAHVIYYVTYSDRIEIIRVLHQRMDVSASVFE